jgi:hypothetical protein
LRLEFRPFPTLAQTGFNPWYVGWVCEVYNSQKKGAQPLRVVGRQKRVFCARTPGGKPARAVHIFG